MENRPSVHSSDYTYRCTADVSACREYYVKITEVESVFKESRQVVMADKRSRQILVQANTFLAEDSQLRLKN